jgi:hypothetical protein
MTCVHDPITTVKVPRSLRERIARDAAASGLTAAAFLSEAVGRWEREQRLDAVRQAYRRVDVSYGAETAEWDSSIDDGG